MIYKKFKQTIEKEKLLKDGDSICIAVSGGPDSVALFHLMRKLRQEMGVKLSVCHFNHKQRGRASDLDAKFVQNLAKKYRITLELDSLKIERRLSENQLRQERYAFFNKILRSKKTQKIFLAHTADDQIETILFNFFRGSGIRGLSGMDYQKGKYIRPLLDISKIEILKYLKKHKYDFRIDQTNKDIGYSRNRIREQILPEIEKINPSFKKSLLGQSKVIKEQEKLVNLVVQEKIKKLKVDDSEFSAAAWDKMGPELQGEILRHLIERADPGPKDPKSSQVRELREILKKPDKGKILGRLKFKRKDDKIYITEVKKLKLKIRN